MTKSYLTVDDAPTGELPEKVALLEERDVPAIFFCEGGRLAEHPDAAREAVEAGYHLGNHAYSHEHASDLTVAEFREEVERTEERLESVYEAASIARPERLFRFPYGDKGDGNAEALQEVLAEWEFVPPDPDRFTFEWYQEEHADDRDWFWTVSVEDWEAESREELAANLDESADRLDADSENLILFHDGGNTPELFGAFLDLLEDRGVELGDPLDLV